MLIAAGVADGGRREIPGFKLADSESESSWGEFFSELKERGLEGIDGVTMDLTRAEGGVRGIQRAFSGGSAQLE